MRIETALGKTHRPVSSSPSPTAKPWGCLFSMKGYGEGLQGVPEQRSKAQFLVAEIMVMKSVRFRFKHLFAGLSAIAFLAGAAAAAPAPAPAQGSAPAANANKPLEPSEAKNFGDWTVRCFPPSAKIPCQMLELLVTRSPAGACLAC